MGLPGNVVLLRTEVGLSDRDDDELMSLARGGVEGAFETLVRRHQHAAIEVARRQLLSIDLAKDATQNAFVELYKYLPKYEARGKFKAFFYKLLLNHCRMVRRSLGRSSKIKAELELVEQPMAELPDAEVIRRERWREVEQSLKRLSPKLRTVVTLRFSAGLSYEEIAEAVDVHIGTVKSRLFNGIRKLREDLRA